MEKLRIVFMGTPSFGVPTLLSLIDKYNVVGVVTQPDKLVGRNQELEESPIKKVAKEYNIPVFQPVKIRLDYQGIVDLKPDLIVTAAYGQIVNMELLDCPKYRSINIHGSLLPKYRGASPIQEAIKNGDKVTGISIMYMEKAMDSGDVLKSQEVVIEDDDTTGSLFEKMSIVGRDLVLEVIDELINGTTHPIKQGEEKITFCSMIKKEDELLDFNDSAYNLVNKVRAYNPNPIAYMKLDDEEIKVYKACVALETSDLPIGSIIKLSKKRFGIVCKDSSILEILELKPVGKKLMNAVDYVNGGLNKHIRG